MPARLALHSNCAFTLSHHDGPPSMGSPPLAQQAAEAGERLVKAVGRVRSALAQHYLTQVSMQLPAYFGI